MKHLLIKGNSGVGKTTMILDCIASYKNQIGGFVTQRLIEQDGETKGFCLTYIQKVESPRRPYQKSLEHIFIEHCTDGWTKNPEVFTKTGIEMIDDIINHHRKMAVLDEIGGVELNNKQFMEKLYELLAGNIPCLIVLKNTKNYESMKERIMLTQAYDDRRLHLEEELVTRFPCEILTMTEENQAMVKQKLKQFVYEQMEGKKDEM